MKKVEVRYRNESRIRKVGVGSIEVKKVKREREVVRMREKKRKWGEIKR